MSLFRGSKNATIVNGEIVATAQDIADAVNDAIAAKNAAELAETGAQTAETNAETAETNAETAETNAETAESGAVDAQSYAEEWANKAEDSLISTDAGGDGVDDFSALHHANKASDSASAASTSESNAATSETNAQQAATDAETALDTFTDQYLGAKASDPTTDNDGDPLQDGALYFNTSDNSLRIYSDSLSDWVVVEVRSDSDIRNLFSAGGDVTYNSTTGEFSFAERTDSEIRNLFSAADDLSYNASTGEFSVTTYKSGDFDTDFGTKDTDDLTEGTGNLYYTDARARGAVSASGDLSYNAATGVFSFTETPNYTDADVDAHLTGGTGVTYSSGNISIGQDVGTGASVTFLDAEFTGSGAVELPEGTEGQRPGTPASGMIRFNSDAGAFEGYNGSEWGEIGGAAAANGLFSKSDSDSVAWTKTGSGTAETGQTIYVEVGGEVLEIASGTTIAMPTLSDGTDYAIWVAPDGTLEANASFNVAPTAGGRRIGGFHYAPGGNASLDPAGNWNNHTGGNTTPQINEYSFYDLKWRPSVADPRGLTLVNESFWTGIYLMSATTTVAPLHKYNLEPARGGNNPQKPYGDGTTYGNAKPMNVFECLSYYGFRAPDVNEFQLLALGVNEERSIGGSGPGNTGDVSDRSKNEQTSAWGVMDATGVLRVWGRDSLPDNNQDNGVTEGRSDNRFRISRFTVLGGAYTRNVISGSRSVNAFTSSNSDSLVGGRGVCSHVILP